MQLQKRLLFTAPTPRFKFGESSVAAARQPGSTMARRVDYSFVDTMDANVRRRGSLEFYAWHQDAQTDHAVVRVDIEVLRRERIAYEKESSESRQALARSEAHNRALEARVVVLETQAYRHEWQRQDVDDHATKVIMRIQALEAGARIDTLEDTAERDADRSRNGDDNHDSGSSGRRQAPPTRECTYSDFLKCQPLNFKGTEGVVGLNQWFEKMESKTLKKMMTDKYCPRGEIKKLEIKMWNLKVKGTDVVSYNQRFQELSLMCSRMFPEESDEIKKYAGGMPDKIHGSVMASKPKTMQDAIEFATKLMDQKIRTLAENKRKFEDTSRNN
ncbi:hypothetical protein Tco_0272327 [Tanacetum coccineum]